MIITEDDLPEGAAYFPGYESAIIGVTDDDRVAYDYHRLCLAEMANAGCTYEEAEEWVQFNTLRSIPYMGSQSPVVIYRFEEDQE